MRVVGLGAVVAIVIVAGVSALRNRNGDGVTTTSGGNVATTPETTAAPRPAEVTASQAARIPDAATPTPTAPAAAPVALSRAFVVVEGRTALSNGIFAVRAGDSVVVNFDSQGFRTRRADKFEETVRSTLPMIYGRGATAHLDTVPRGALVRSRDVIGELQSSGAGITLDNGTRILLRAVTRVGRDGPLAVAYVTTIRK